MGKLAPIPPSEPPLVLLQIGVAETGTSRLEGRAWMRVLSVANLFHKPAGISATSGCPWGCKGLWTSKASCPVWCGTPRLYAAGTAAIMALSSKQPNNIDWASSDGRLPLPAAGLCTGDPVTRRELHSNMLSSANQGW